MERSSQVTPSPEAVGRSILGFERSEMRSFSRNSELWWPVPAFCCARPDLSTFSKHPWEERVTWMGSLFRPSGSGSVLSPTLRAAPGAVQRSTGPAQCSASRWGLVLLGSSRFPTRTKFSGRRCVGRDLANPRPKLARAEHSGLTLQPNASSEDLGILS